jgi:hypothetical protein
MMANLAVAKSRPALSQQEDAWLDAAPSVLEYRSFLATIRQALGDPVPLTPKGYRPSRRELRIIEREVLSRLAVRTLPPPLVGRSEQ